MNIARVPSLFGISKHLSLYQILTKYKAAIYDIEDICLVLNAFTYIYVQSKPFNVETLYYVKRTSFQVLTIPELYQISLIMRTLITTFVNLST